MHAYSLAFQSPVLAQKKLLENLKSSAQSERKCVTMDVNPCNEIMTPISTIPVLRKELAVSTEKDHPRISQEVRELINGLSKKVYDEELNSERGRQTISKAMRYNIPFDKDDIDFLELMDKISDYEYLLKRADELELDWDESDYDFAGLEAAIIAANDDPERVRRNDNAQHRRDYYASIALY